MSYINYVLKYEVTFIPGLLNRYFGNYYNNALCNGATWMFAIWFSLHLSFDTFLNALLTRMRFQKYTRARLIQSLWYLGFYVAAMVYCLTILSQSRATFFTHRNSFEIINGPNEKNFIILGLTMLSTFFLHSAVWEALKNNNFTSASGYLSMFFTFIFAYYLRFVRSSLKFVVLAALSNIVLESSRCVKSLMPVKTIYSNRNIRFMLGANISIFLLSDFLTIPILIFYPLTLKIFKPESVLLIFLLGWFASELQQSVLLRLSKHYLYHAEDLEEEKISPCRGDILNCSLFEPRNDATANLQEMRLEVIKRKEKVQSMRKQRNNKAMVMQTLKCMVALKRKLRQRRNRDLSESASSSDEETAASNKMKEQEVLHDDDSERIVGGKLQFNIQNNKDTVKRASENTANKKED